MPVSRLLAEWPLLLCGPILRLVDLRSVSVFVVLKHQRTVELRILSGMEEIRGVVTEHEEETRRLGKHLHADGAGTE